jgi:peptidoglycan/xylan/chitin deacetylase (PgdA/CDA1 family)
MSSSFVLMYHRVVERRPDTRCWFERGTAVSPGALDRQLAWLREHFEVVPLEALLEPAALDGRGRVALTFDDGYTDTLDVAAAICARHRLAATCFGCSGPAFGGPPLWFDTWYSLVHLGLERGDWAAILVHLGIPPTFDLSSCVTGPPKRWLMGLGSEQRLDLLRALACAMNVPFPTSLQLKLDGLDRLRRLGWRIGGHGVDHVRLADCDVETVEHELAQSRRLLTEVGESHPLMFAYPDGSWNAGVVEAVARAGFAIACTTAPGSCSSAGNPLETPRLFARGEAAVPHGQLGSPQTRSCDHPE